jgi:hypothetical protein
MDDVNTRAIVGIGAAVVASVLAAVLLVFLLLRAWDIPPRVAEAQLPYRVVIEGPALQSAPQPDLAAYRAEKRQLLEGLVWLDAERGIARIPIGEAMALLARSAASAPATPEVTR